VPTVVVVVVVELGVVPEVEVVVDVEVVAAGTIRAFGPRVTPARRAFACALCRARRMSSRALEYVSMSEGRCFRAA
jgi:hypothetical protein